MKPCRAVPCLCLNIAYVLVAFASNSVAEIANDLGSSNKEDITCIDKVSAAHCGFWRKHGACLQFKQRLMKWCMSTCEFCVPVDRCKSFPCPHGKSCMLDKSGNPMCACPNYCTKKITKQALGKICATDGNVYKSRCDMELAACQQEKYITVKNYGECKTEDCIDKYPQETCLLWKKNGACTYWRSYMMNACSMTCGICAFSSKVCASSKYGCCMDMRTMATGPNAKGCPRCKNRFSICKSFESDCNSTNENNLRFMKSYCPKVCGYC